MMRSGASAVGLVLAWLAIVFADSHPQRTEPGATPAAQATSQEREPLAGLLYRSEAIEFQAAAPQIAVTNAHCDQNGNIYVIYSGSYEATRALPHFSQSLPITKLSPDSRSAVEFSLRQLQGYDDYWRLSFYVDPRGTVYALLDAVRRDAGPGAFGESLIVKFRDDGTVDSVTKLEPPHNEHIRAWSFAVFLDGSFLVSGVVLDEKQIPKEPFTAIFHRGGELGAALSLPDDVRAEPPKAPPAKSLGQSGQTGGVGEGPAARPQRPPHVWESDIQRGIMVGSLDGNVYLLRATTPPRLYAISPTGVVLREVVLKPPDPDMEITQISLTGQNRLVALFAVLPVPWHPKPRTVLALADLSTGDVVDTYDVPQGPSASFPVCATSENEFLFLGTSKDDHLEVVKYAAR